MKYFRFELAEDFEGVFQVFYAPIPMRTDRDSVETETFQVTKPNDCFLMKFPNPGKIRLDVYWKSKAMEEQSFGDVQRARGLFKVERVWSGQGYSKDELRSIGVNWQGADWAQFEFPEKAVLYFSRPDRTTPAQPPSLSDAFYVPISFVRTVVDYYDLIGRSMSSYIK